SGSLDALSGLFAEDVRLVSDSGGKAKAPVRVIEGTEKVSRFLTAISTPEATQAFMLSIGAAPAASFDFVITDINAGPAAVIRADGRPIVVISLLVNAGRIDCVYLMSNPEKLAGVSRTGDGQASERA